MSITRRLHIVCPAAPWPLTSGSTIDMFYRIRSLHAEGVGIILHYFSLPEERHPTELNPYCESIHIYPLVKRGSSHLPKSIRLRLDPALLARLQQDQYPVLLEGLSCCGFIDKLASEQRKIVVRIQQLQHRYLQERAKTTRHPLEWMRSQIERKKLLRFKRQLPSSVIYACVNQGQSDYYKEHLRLATATSLPVFIRQVADRAAVAMALIENIQRENLNPLEEARALQRLVLEFDITHEEAARAVGRSRAGVSNLLRLLDLPESVRALVEARRLDMGHARALLGLPAGPRQEELARQAAEGAWSVREIEARVRALTTHTPPQPPKPADPDIRRLETDLTERLGARVQIRAGAKGKGQLVIDYTSLDVLDGIIAHLRGEAD